MPQSTTPEALRLHRLIEPIHAVTYFHKRSGDALADLGLRGFWMGYFAGRSAPLGHCSSPLVEATFYNFAPKLVRRAVPDAWNFASPEEVIEARATGAAAALAELCPTLESEVTRFLPLLESAARAARCEGKPLAACNAALAARSLPLERLWMATTVLREHRGDCHIAALVAHEIGGLESHLLRIGSSSSTEPIEEQRTLITGARAWTHEEWDQAQSVLVDRGLLQPDGRCTSLGNQLHERIEELTNQSALQPYHDGLAPEGRELLAMLMRPTAQAIWSSGSIPAVNPMGLTQ